MLIEEQKGELVKMNKDIINRRLQAAKKQIESMQNLDLCSVQKHLACQTKIYPYQTLSYKSPPQKDLSH